MLVKNGEGIPPLLSEPIRASARERAGKLLEASALQPLPPTTPSRAMLRQAGSERLGCGSHCQAPPREGVIGSIDPQGDSERVARRTGFGRGPGGCHWQEAGRAPILRGLANFGLQS